MYIFTAYIIVVLWRKKSSSKAEGPLELNTHFAADVSGTSILTLGSTKINLEPFPMHYTDFFKPIPTASFAKLLAQ